MRYCNHMNMTCIQKFSGKFVYDVPKFPQPATIALAVPTISFANIILDQYSHITKVPPAIPINNRTMTRLVAELIRPVHAVGIDAEHSTTRYRIRAPYLSQSGPKMNRTTMVLPTPAIDDVQISRFVKSRSFWISGSNGPIANQIKNATKNANHVQWNALMCGLAKLQSLISVAISFCFESIVRSYEVYFFQSDCCNARKHHKQKERTKE
jgi:hypothetical protein